MVQVRLDAIGYFEPEPFPLMLLDRDALQEPGNFQPHVSRFDLDGVRVMEGYHSSRQ